MDSKNLKKVIKQLVRESLVEIFAEMKLESIVESVTKKQLAELKINQPTVMREVRNSIPQENKKNLMDKVGNIESDVWRSMYSDVIDKGNPILNEARDEGATNPEFVPENVMESLGLMKDYSRAAGLEEDSSKSTEENEWSELRKKRTQMLQSLIKP